ncbi:MAG: adenosylcobinamide-phosphate synthase CbiB [Peptococcaceae bacterium]|nr:adenosylcobinamide-phosphate synthase CbiB [Peptococcaceae bacterium]
MSGPALVALAFLVDMVVGDPPRLPHPVVMMGKMISGLERVFYAPGKARGMAGGAVTALIVVASAYAATAGLIYFLRLVHPWLAAAAEIWIISTTLAARGLAQAAGEVLRPLASNHLDLARRMVGRIVGRETGSMNAREVTRATVESVAENTVDGVIAPLFYAFAGGAPLAMAYKAVNTLDSMVGYRNERYLYFGRFSARLDDAANFLPARIGGLMLAAAAWITGRRARGALRAMVRDARRHPSPNSGIPEAAVAGALGVRLGGLNVYGGRESFRNYLGDDVCPLAPDHIRQAVDLMYMSSFLALAAGAAVHLLAGMLFGTGGCEL